jgi:hypothetical protein
MGKSKAKSILEWEPEFLVVPGLWLSYLPCRVKYNKMWLNYKSKRYSSGKLPASVIK